MDIETTKKLAMPLAVLLLLIFLLMQLQGLSIEQNVSSAYTSFYFNLAVIGAIGFVATAAFGLKYGDVLGIPGQYKFAILAIWVIFIVMISSSGQQIIPVPKASAGDLLQINKQTELYTSSVIPAITEDAAYLWVFPMTLLLFMGLFAEGVGIEIGRGQLLALAIIACFVASIGYNTWLIPGFTSAHVPAYGNNQVAYTGAFIFSFGQSMVYVFTGWFAPIAHGVHNFIVTYGQLYQVSIG